MRYPTLLLLSSIVLNRRLTLPMADKRSLEGRSAWVGLDTRRCSLLFSILYIPSLASSIVALQYSYYCYQYLYPRTNRPSLLVHRSTLTLLSSTILESSTIRVRVSSDNVEHDLVIYPSPPSLIPKACRSADLRDSIIRILLLRISFSTK
jgi:hypothetical protein